MGIDRSWARLFVWLLAFLVVGTAARAQTLYLSVDPARPRAGDEVGVRLMRGIPFAGKPVGLGDLRSMQLQRLWHAGRSELKPVTAADPATFRPAEPGVQVIAYLPQPDASGYGDGASFGKALLVVGDPPRAERIWRSELGQRLEIIPRTDPVALLRQGGALDVQVLFDREPLAGATVAAVAEEAAVESYQRAVTDTMGHVTLELARPGRWLVHLAHKSFEGEGWVLFQSSLLLTVGP